MKAYRAKQQKERVEEEDKILMLIRLILQHQIVIIIKWVMKKVWVIVNVVCVAINRIKQETETAKKYLNG